MSDQKNFIDLEDHAGQRFSIPRESIIYFRDNGWEREVRLCTVRFCELEGTRSERVVEVQVKNSYDELKAALGLTP